MARDWDVLDDIRAKLLATQQFDSVYRSAAPETRGQAAGDRFAAVVSLKGWDEVSESADPTVIQSTRRVRWQLTLIVREDDPETRERHLDRLLAVAQTAIDGQVLAGVTIPAWSWLASGAYDTPVPPGQAMTVQGQFSYWISGFTGHDTDDF